MKEPTWSYADDAASLDGPDMGTSESEFCDENTHEACMKLPSMQHAELPEDDPRVDHMPTVEDNY